MDCKEWSTRNYDDGILSASMKSLGMSLCVFLSTLPQSTFFQHHELFSRATDPYVSSPLYCVCVSAFSIFLQTPGTIYQYIQFSTLTY